MPVGQARESRLRQGLRDLPLEPLIQSPKQHVGSGRGISMHGDHRIAAGDEIEGARLVEAIAGKVEAVEIIPGRPQAFEQVEPMLVAGDQTRNLRRAAFDAPAVRRGAGYPGTPAGRAVHGKVDAFLVVLREMFVVAKVVGRNQFTHWYSLPPQPTVARCESRPSRPAPPVRMRVK